MPGTFAEATAIGGLPVPVAGIALPRAATRCFPDLVSRDPNGLVLISFRPARTRAYARPRGLARRLAILTNIRLPYSQYNFADIGTRQRVRVCVEELLSPDLDQIKQVEQAA